MDSELLYLLAESVTESATPFIIATQSTSQTFNGNTLIVNYNNFVASDNSPVGFSSTSLSAGSIIAPQTGMYSISVCINFNIVGASGNNSLGVNVGNSAAATYTYRGVGCPQSTIAGANQLSMTIPLRVVQGQYISGVASGAGAGVATAGTTNPYTWISVVYLGPA